MIERCWFGPCFKVIQYLGIGNSRTSFHQLQIVLGGHFQGHAQTRQDLQQLGIGIVPGAVGQLHSPESFAQAGVRLNNGGEVQQQKGPGTGLGHGVECCGQVKVGGVLGQRFALVLHRFDLLLNGAAL